MKKIFLFFLVSGEGIIAVIQKAVNIKSILKSLGLIFGGFFLLNSSCNESGNIGYHHITIPGYVEEDYFSMLNNPSYEIQYNAICNLYAYADDDLLSQDSLKEKKSYKPALKIYEKVFALMDSKNSWVSSAAIRYVGQIKYNKEATLNYCLNNNNPSVNVQLSIWDIWVNINDYKLTVPSLQIKKVNFCLNHPSWLIQQCAYDYLTPASIHSLEKTIINKYRNSSENYIKLKIIEKVKTHLCDTLFQFLIQEYASTTDTILKQSILVSLPKALNSSKALEWFEQHKSETANVLDDGFALSDKEDDIYAALVLVALQQGWNPLNSFFDTDNDVEIPNLFCNLLMRKYIDERSDSLNTKLTIACKKIEQQLLADGTLRPRWLSFEKKYVKYPLPIAFINDHQLITRQYLEDNKKLFTQFMLDSFKCHEFLNDIENSSKEMYDPVQFKKKYE